MPKRKRKTAAPVLIGPDGEKKCHVACGDICLKLPGGLVAQLTASPLSSVRRVDISSYLKKVHMKTLFKSLVNATGLEEVSIEDGYCGGFNDVVEEMVLVLGRCRKIKMTHLRESSEFWNKCVLAAGSECRELVLEQCDGLEAVSAQLPGLVPRLVHLTIIEPYFEDDESVETNLKAFLEQMVVQSAPIRSLTLDHLYNCLHQVPPDTLATALSQLTKVSLCLVSLGVKQLVALARAWALSAPISLSVESDWGAWKILPAKILLPPLIRVSSLSLKGTKLRPDVVEGLLAAIAGGCAVKKLDLRGNDCSGVAPSIVRGAVLRLSEAVLTQCSLELGAVVEILETLASGDKGELDELVVTKVHPGYDKPKEDKLVKWAKEGSNLLKLELHARQCKCGDFCSWY